MFNLEDILKTISTRMAYISVKPQLCCKAISSHSRCDKCIRICPVKAISIEKKYISIESNCIECGLCASVCPTGAIAIQEPTEEALYRKIIHIGKLYKTVIITCHKNTKILPQVPNIPCMGSLSLEFLFAINLLPYSINMFWEKNTCQQCKALKGIKEYMKRLERIEKLQNKLGIFGNSIEHIEKAPKIKSQPAKKETDVDVERRKLLYSVFDGLRRLPKETVDSFMGRKEKSDIKKTKTTNNHSRFLKKVIEKAEVLDTKIDIISFPRLVNTCFFCKACTILCPMNALKFDKDGSLILYRDRCVGCGLCADICYHESLKMIIAGSRDLKEDKLKLAKRVKQKCKTCGRDVIASKYVEKCPACSK